MKAIALVKKKWKPIFLFLEKFALKIRKSFLN